MNAQKAMLIGIIIDAIFIALSFINDGFIGIAISFVLLTIYSIRIYFKTN